jgi:hypothetical protein
MGTKPQKVYIAMKLKKFVIIVNATRQLWANEFFKTEEEAEDFCNQNGLELVAQDFSDFNTLSKRSNMSSTVKRFCENLNIKK